jgi:hypothetical protein
MNMPKICVLQVPLSFHDIIVCINFTVGKATEYILSIFKVYFLKLLKFYILFPYLPIFLRYTPVRVTCVHPPNVGA